MPISLACTECQCQSGKETDTVRITHALLTHTFNSSFCSAPAASCAFASAASSSCCLVSFFLPWCCLRVHSDSTRVCVCVTRALHPILDQPLCAQVLPHSSERAQKRLRRYTHKEKTATALTSCPQTRCAQTQSLFQSLAAAGLHAQR